MITNFHRKRAKTVNMLQVKAGKGEMALCTNIWKVKKYSITSS